MRKLYKFIIIVLFFVLFFRIVSLGWPVESIPVMPTRPATAAPTYYLNPTVTIPTPTVIKEYIAGE